jgi:acyl-CoA reductase-like NAD-dependent aldehyde dehydrogenase
MSATVVAAGTVGNVIAGREGAAAAGEVFEKVSPATGDVLALVARSRAVDVEAAVGAALGAQTAWAEKTVVDRGAIIRQIARLLERDLDEIASIVAAETGKSPRDALAETGGAIEMGYFVAGEGRRFYGRTTTSGVVGRQAMTVRQPLGVAGLIIAANTPIANVAWKVFPAILCGNAAVLKASEDAPWTALAFARLAAEAGLPDGVLNVVQGLGPEAGQPLAEDRRVGIVSFTGSTAVGRMIAGVAGERLAKVCLELGGKNPFVVCDDADLERAARSAALSAFSNAGQRCASGSRIIVVDAVYDRFVELLVGVAESQRVGPTDDDDLGPVINARQLERMLDAVERARAAGRGFYMAPTLIENAALDSELACTELFGPIATIHRVSDYRSALAAANDTAYGLTAAIWTRDVSRAHHFVTHIRSGVASINAATYGSEPHLPFGGLGDSGTGWREAGTEALDVYSDWKTVYVNHDPEVV